MLQQLLAALVDLILARVESRIENADIVKLVKHEIEQAVIQLRFAEMEVTSRMIDIQHVIQKIEERAAFERGLANQIPDVEIIRED